MRSSPSRRPKRWAIRRGSPRSSGGSVRDEEVTGGRPRPVSPISHRGTSRTEAAGQDDSEIHDVTRRKRAAHSLAARRARRRSANGDVTCNLPRTVGELRRRSPGTRGVKQEIRENLRTALGRRQRSAGHPA